MHSDSDILKAYANAKRKNRDDNSVLMVLLDIRQLLAQSLGVEIPESDQAYMAIMRGELPDVPENHPAANAGPAPANDVASRLEINKVATQAPTIDPDAVRLEDQQKRTGHIHELKSQIAEASAAVDPSTEEATTEQIPQVTSPFEIPTGESDGAVLLHQAE